MITKRKPRILALVLVFTVALSLLGGSSFASTTSSKVTPVYTKANAKNYTVKFKQTAVGSTSVQVNFPYIQKQKKVYKVKISFAMIYKGKTVKSKTYNTKVSTLKKNKNTLQAKLPALGKYTATVKYYTKKGKRIKKLTVKNVGAVANEYNIAVLSGTMGPLIFSMDLWDNSKDSKGNTIPTVVSLTRPSAYDWSKLPKGVSVNPMLKSYNDCSFSKIFPAAEAYVKDLYSLNKNSKFHFHFTDFSAAGILQLADRNKIPESNFDVSLYSDGSGSYAYFNKVFGDSNAEKVYDKMSGQWELARKSYRSGHSIDIGNMYGAVSSGVNGLKSYALVAAKESSNIKWYVTRKSGTFTSQDGQFLSSALESIDEVSLNNKLNVLKENGLDGAFKNLYHFDNQMFDSAKGKRVMVLMGSRVTNETNFKEFSSFVKKYYGPTYAYYYKGHPATPTSLYPNKIEDLKAVGIEDIESSIPAELILFFYPDVEVSGMSNSTLNLSYKAGNTKAYFGTRIANKGSITGGDLFELFFTKINSSYESEIKDLCVDDASLEYSYLVEYAGNENADIAIYNYKNNTIKNYKYIEATEADEENNIEAVPAHYEAVD